MKNYFIPSRFGHVSYCEIEKKGFYFQIEKLYLKTGVMIDHEIN